MAMQPPVRVPLVWEPTPHKGNSRDALRVNVMDEKMGDQLYCLQRPGLDQLDFGFPASTPGQGITKYKNRYVAVINDTLWWSSPPVIAANVAGGTTIFSNTPWTQRTGQASCVYNGRMYIAGGANLSLTADVTDIWSTDNPANGTRWRLENASAPWGWRTGASLVVHNNRMFFMGGNNPATGALYHDVWSSTDGVEWKEETPAAAWNGRSQFGVVSYGGSMILTGGSDDPTVFAAVSNFDDVWSSSDGAKWTRVATAPWGRRWAHSFAVVNNKLILSGGVIAGVVQNNSWVSTDGGTTWTLGNAAPWATPRAFMGTCVYRGRIWTLAGISAPGVYTAPAWSTNDGIAWTLEGNVHAVGASSAEVFPSPSTDPNPNVNTIYQMAGFNGAIFNTVRYLIPSITSPTSITLAPAVINLSYQMMSFQNGARLVVKNASNMWSITDIATPVTDYGYPVETVPGVVALGGFLFVMDRSGLIYNCELDDMTKWPSLNVIGADFTDDEGVYLGRYKNYIVALGQYTTQLFLDGGLNFGSPLRPYLNANTEVGCYHASTVGQYADILVWVSRTRDGFLQVVALNGGRPEVISTTAVEKSLGLLADDEYGAPFQACVMSIGGHVFYFLPVIGFGPSGNELFTWVYDFTTKEWLQWRSDVLTTPFLFAAADAGRALDTFNGRVWALNEARGDDGDAHLPINCIWRSVPVDGGTKRKKFWGRTDLVGDQSSDAGGPVTFNLRWSDDMAATYTLPRTFNLTEKRPAMFRNGSSERRIFELSTTTNYKFRVQAIEMQLEVEPM